MRHAGLLASLCLCATLAGRAQTPMTFVGTLEPELTPGPISTGLEMLLASSKARAKLGSHLSDDEQLWVGELGTNRGRQLLYLIVSGGEGRAVMADLDGDGALGSDERVPLTKADEPGLALAATLRFAVRNAAFPAFPIRVGLSQLDTPLPRGTRLYLAASGEAFVVGRVTIDGVPVKVQLPAGGAALTVNPARGYQYVDCNGDGHIDTDMTSWEMGFGRGKPIVFHIEPAGPYVSIWRVDLAAKTIALMARTGAEYPRIELRLGSTLPDFGFTAMDGSGRRLSEFRGKYLLMDFWGTWCGPCVGEIPFLRKAYDTYRDKGFEILGMDREIPDETPEDFARGLKKVKTFIADNGVIWPQAQTESIKFLYMHRFQIVAWPTLVLLDPNGVVLSVDRTDRGEPALRGERLDQTLAAIFAGK
jgi:thiol-disulfide isomerase/thioredoxin